MATIEIDPSAVPLAENLNKDRPNPPIRSNRRRRSCFQWFKILPPTYKFFLIVMCLVVGAVSYLYLQKLINFLTVSHDISSGKEAKYIPDPETPLPASGSILHQFQHGAVCSDSKRCSKIGSDILENKGGNIFDAAIATLFCNGIDTIQSMGIGGGFVMNIYIHNERKAITLNAKEVAPLAAREDMFNSDYDYLLGPRSAAVPGEVKGYWELHQKYGSLPWKDLLEPTIEICEQEVQLSKHTADFIKIRQYDDELMRNVFFYNGTKTPRRHGDFVKMPIELCNTFRILAEKGGDDYYTGTLADLIADDLRDLGTTITKEDLLKYKVRWEESLSLPLNNNTVYVTQSPTGGPIVAFILNILKGYNFTSESIKTEEEQIQTYHRFIEAFKFAFGYRTQLSDYTDAGTHELVKKMLSPEHAEHIRSLIKDNETSSDPKYYGGEFETLNNHGTSHVSILAPNGDAISVTSSINLYYGIGKMGKRTGIIFNNGMNDFAVKNLKNYFNLPASPKNSIAPQKRAMSSLAPVIVTNADGDVNLVIGAAGGTKIPTAISLVIARLFWFGQNIKEAVDGPRIHHQLSPMEVQYEYGNTKKLITGLESLGHKMLRYTDRGSIICAIVNQTGIFANADYRKAGEVVGL